MKLDIKYEVSKSLLEDGVNIFGQLPGKWAAKQVRVSMAALEHLKTSGHGSIVYDIHFECVSFEALVKMTGVFVTLFTAVMVTARELRKSIKYTVKSTDPSEPDLDFDGTKP